METSYKTGSGVRWGPDWQEIEGDTGVLYRFIKTKYQHAVPARMYAVGLTKHAKLVTCLVLFLSFNPKDKHSIKTLRLL